MVRSCLGLLFLLGGFAPLTAAPHRATRPAPESFTLASAAGEDILYFEHERELWRSDGTAEGTYRVLEACANRCLSGIGSVNVLQDRLYFSAWDASSGEELWTSDGTPRTERKVRDLCPGACSSAPGFLEELGDRLFFLASPRGVLQLFATDGSRGGTESLKVLCRSGGDLSSCQPGVLGRAGERLLFWVDLAGEQRSVLWSSDGTSAGTLPVRSVPFSIGQMYSLGNVGLFWGDDALWHTDGTAGGTKRLKAMADLVVDPHRGNGSTNDLVWHGSLYSLMYEGELVRSDGTAEGTVRIAVVEGENASPLTPLSSEILLARYDSRSSVTSLWRTRGTPETTEKFLTFPGFLSGYQSLASLGDRAVFLRRAGDLVEIWGTDGTEGGSQPLITISLEERVDEFGLRSAGQKAFFFRGQELWCTDGTVAGTRLVRDLGAPREAPEIPGPMAQAALGSELLFAARISGEISLLASDGTPEGSRIVRQDIYVPDRFLSWKTGVLFTSPRTRSDFDLFTLWRTDGTAAGTRSLAPINTGFWPSVMSFGDLLVFGSGTWSDQDGPHDVELWRTDGTRRGTVRVADINREVVPRRSIHCESGSSDPGPGIALAAGALVFAADDGKNGTELWATDGTAAGTRPVRDINPGRTPVEPDFCNPLRQETGLSSDPGDFTASGRGALLTADDGRTGRELWWTDGTFQGTRRVKDIRPGRAGSEPHDLLAFHGFVYFFAASGPSGTGEALWRSDGTARGTTIVSDLRLGGLPSWGSRLTAVRDRLFFSVDNETTGPELWTSEGDAASTGLVVDLRPGPAGSYPQELTPVGNVLVFAAADGEHGLEAWRSDGTPAGTRILDDFNPGPDAGAPGPFTRAGAFVFTGASDGAHERGLWPIPLSDVLRP